MALPERISLETLTRVYAAVGFRPVEGEPATFVGLDGTEIDHDPRDDGTFVVAFVLMDVRDRQGLFGTANIFESFFNALMDEVE